MEKEDKVIQNLNYVIKKYQEQITRIKSIQKHYKGTLVEKNLEKEIQKFTGEIQKLTQLKESIKPVTKADEDIEKTVPTELKDEAHFKDEVIVEKIKTSEETTEKSLDSVIDILQTIADERKTENEELKKEIQELKKSNDWHHGKATRLAWIFGLGAIAIAFVLTALT